MIWLVIVLAIILGPAAWALVQRPHRRRRIQHPDATRSADESLTLRPSRGLASKSPRRYIRCAHRCASPIMAMPRGRPITELA